MRTPIALEAYDLTTLWPVKVYPSYVAAEASGYNRRNIAAVVAGRRPSHEGLGWRIADPLSTIDEFLAGRYEIRPDAPEVDCVTLGDVYAAMRHWAGNRSIDGIRLRRMLDARFGVVFLTEAEYVDPHGGYSVPSYRHRINGLVDAIGQKRWLY